MTTILVLHAAVGMGHYRAATAIAQAWSGAGTAAQVEDTLDYAHPWFRKTYADLYLGIAGHVPSFWSSFYARTDRRLPWFHPVAAGRALGTRFGVRGLAALVDHTRPDAIICTHFLPLEILGPLRQAGLAPPLYSVVTDYRAHHFWAVAGVDGHFVPTTATAWQLAAAGVPSSAIHVTGIPVDPALARPRARHTIRQELHLPINDPIVLLNGSGIAVQRVRSIVGALLTAGMTGTLVIAAGRNRTLLAALAYLRDTSATRIRVLGPQPSLDPWIAASDLVIGKAGGLTVSETLSRGVPLVIPTPVPGQEQANADHVVGGGAGLTCDTPHGVTAAALTLLRDPAQRLGMAQAARRLGRPDAAAAIVAQMRADLQRADLPRAALSPIPAPA